MLSVVLYDVRTGEIIRSHPAARGSAPPPSKEDLLRSCDPPIEESEQEYFDTLEVPYELFTQDAVNCMRVVNRDVINKPLLNMTSTEITNKEYLIQLSLFETIEGEAFEDVSISLDDEPLRIPLENNSATFGIEFEDTGTYKLESIDKRFFSHPLIIEVIG